MIGDREQVRARQVELMEKIRREALIHNCHPTPTGWTLDINLVAVREGESSSS